MAIWAHFGAPNGPRHTTPRRPACDGARQVRTCTLTPASEIGEPPMPRYEIVSADAHVLEPTDIWDEWLPKKHREKAPKLVKDIDGGDAWQFAGAADPDPIGLVSTPGMAWDEFRWTGVTYEQARAGCYNGAERLKDMVIDGVDAEILFPPQRTIGHFLGDEDDD